MPRMKYVTWLGRDDAMPELVHNIPVTLVNAAGEAEAGKVPAVFERDFTSGRLVYKANMDGEYAAVIDYIEHNLDPVYFAVSDEPPAPNRHYLRTLFSQQKDLSTFEKQIEHEFDPDRLRKMFVMMKDNGVSPMFMRAVEKRIDELESMSTSQSERYDSYKSEMSMQSDEAPSPRRAKSRQAPPSSAAGADSAVSPGSGAA